MVIAYRQEETQMNPLILELLKKNLNAPGLFNDVLDRVIEPALENLVKNTPTPIDNVVLAALYPLLASELKKEAAKLWADLLVPAPASPSAPSESMPPGNPV
jgi:hypothetical protein